MSEQNPPEPVEGRHRGVPDETDDPDYPATVEGTGSERDDEPVLDEPVEH